VANGVGSLVKKNRGNKSPNAKTNAKRKRQSRKQFASTQHKRTGMEITAYIAGIGAVVVFGVAALLGVLHMRDASIWTTWFACLLTLTGGFCWLQDREWKKDAEQEPLKRTDDKRPYVHFGRTELTEPLRAGVSPRVVFSLQNTGPKEATVKMHAAAWYLTYDRNDRALDYKPRPEFAAPSFIIGPWGRYDGHMPFPDFILTADQAAALNSGRAWLFFFSRGEYIDEEGKGYPLDFLRVYDKSVPGQLILTDATFK
jgi:hypothetical protein